jgi:hypothetical protein
MENTRILYAISTDRDSSISPMGIRGFIALPPLTIQESTPPFGTQLTVNCARKPSLHDPNENQAAPRVDLMAQRHQRSKVH